MVNSDHEIRSNHARDASVGRVDMKLEVVVIPVSDVDRAKEFYGRLGWRLDADFATDDDFRVIQFTPPGSACSVIFGKNVTAAAPGSAQGLYLIVSDIEAARDDLVGRGVETSEVFHDAGDEHAGTDEPYLFGRLRISGPDSEHRSYHSFATFSDPDGNGWLFQEVTTRLPGRGLSLDVATLTELLRETERRHGEYEPTAPKHHWSGWYAAYIAARENGRTSDEAAKDAALNIEGARERRRGRADLKCLELPSKRCLISRHFDVIIIGTGQAGPSLAARFAAAGMAVAIVERHKSGGTCVNTGCIPTKTLIASAYAAHVARRGAEYGFAVNGEVRVDMKRVKARKDEISGRSNRGVEEWLRGLDNCTVIQGHARFESSRSVEVNDEVLRADKIFINVGGRASVPAIPGIHAVPFFTNSSMMDVDFLPEQLVIVGGSYVGLEFAQMYRRFGSEVTIVEMGPHLIGREDEDVSATVREIMEVEGIRIRTNAKCISLTKRESRIGVGTECNEGPPDVLGTHVLLAVGRTPNTNDLGLDRAGVATNQRGYIVVDDQLQTNVPGIWALGDCNGRGAFTHTSYNDHEIVADNLLNADHRRVSDRIQTYALFTDPPLGRCGMTDAEIRKSGRAALAAKYPMNRVGRAIENGETQGFIKISVDAETEHILGAAILGTGGDEVVQVLLDVMYAKAPYTVIQRQCISIRRFRNFFPPSCQNWNP